MDENSVVKARAEDICSLADRREFEFVYSAFLTPAEQAEFFRAVPVAARARLFFFGGCLGADRRRAIFAPSYTVRDDLPPCEAFSTEREKAFSEILSTYFPDEAHDVIGICPLRVRGSGFATLAHRDYMGTILALGVERSVIGDIAVTGEHEAVVFADEKIAPFLTSELVRVARDTVHCTPARVGLDFVIPRKFESLSAVAASARADSIVAALASCSRAEAKTLCLSGDVAVNYISPTEPDRALVPGDIVSVRSCGKFIIDSFGGTTRSGRMRFTARRFL